MKQIYLIFIVLFSKNAFALFNTDITGGCDSQTLQTINNITYLEPVFTLSVYNCDSGYYLPSNTEGCVICSQYHYCSGGTFAFNPDKDQGIIISCPSGYFAPANTDGCRACPSGYTCAGGTFEFNETYAQGITPKDTLSTDAQFACSSNVLKTVGNTTYLEPIFTPKTIALTYDDGVGNTSSGTCTYDNLISLPEPPTRPGYTFNGWKLQTNNE